MPFLSTKQNFIILDRKKKINNISKPNRSSQVSKSQAPSYNMIPSLITTFKHLENCTKDSIYTPTEWSRIWNRWGHT